VTRSVAELCAQAFGQSLAPEPSLTVSAWADEHRQLSSTASSEPGRWRTARTPYLREIMDTLSPSHPAERVVVMSGAQIGKTECGNNWIGYVIHRSPGPMLMVQPTVEVAKRVSKQRLAPMIASTPVLRERVAEARSRDSGNTVQVKEFEGGLLIITGANSGAGLRSMPIRFLFMDEVDEYPGDVDGQGDPVALAEKRTATFSRRKVFLTSTPTLKGLSRIEREFLDSDRRYYFVPCPECGHFDYLTWRDPAHHRIEWEENLPETAHMTCAGCGAKVEERHKTAMLARGEWRATEPSDGRTVGFHLSALYSPLGWKSWAQCATEFLKVKEDAFRLKTWVNTVLGETWEERGDSVSAGSLAARLERYPSEVPAGVGVLVAAVDVQGDRLEVVVKGYGAGEESWLIAFSQLHGDPARETVWHELDRFLAQQFEHESGQRMRILRTVIDSGGAHTEHVYRYCKARLAAGRSVYPVKGGTLTGRPLLERPSRHNRYRVPLFVLCVDTGKEVVFSRLLISTPGPGYLHLPEWVDAEYLAQLTAEKAIRKYVKGRGAVREWVKLRERNEALDLEVYALAALHVLGPNFVQGLAGRAAAFAKEGEPLPTASAESPAPITHPPAWPVTHRNSWVAKCLPPGRRWRW
jgi:phage terminase large subunit GpA-like protein